VTVARSSGRFRTTFSGKSRENNEGPMRKLDRGGAIDLII